MEIQVNNEGVDQDTFDKKLALVRALKEKVLRLARTDSGLFTEYVFKVKNAWFHQNWHKFLREGNSGLILAFRGSGKTENVTISNTLFEIGNDPSIRTKVITAEDDLAEKVLGRISATIVDNDRYKEVFPNIVPDSMASWNKHQITVQNDAHAKDPTVECASILGGGTGGRADLLHFDDVCGYRNSLYYPALREKVKEAFRNNWMKMLEKTNPKRKWIMTATPWHINDLVSELRMNKAVKKCEEVWVGDNFKSPWPEAIPDQVFKDELLHGLTSYNRAYRGVAQSDDEVYINPLAVEQCKDFTLKPYDIRMNKEYRFFTGVDLGHRDGEKLCPSVIFTVARNPIGKRIVADIKITHSSNPLDIGRAIIRTHEEFHPELIMVENNGAQKYLVDILENMGPKSLMVEGYFTGVQKLDQERGVPGLLVEIETGQWVIPMGAGGEHDPLCECSFCKWVSEIKSWPLGSTDCTMASWLSLNALKKICEKANPGGGFGIWNLG